MQLGWQWLNWLHNFPFSLKKGALPWPWVLIILYHRGSRQSKDQWKASVIMTCLPSDIVFSSLKMNLFSFISGCNVSSAYIWRTLFIFISWAKMEIKRDKSQPLAYTWCIYLFWGIIQVFRVWCTYNFWRPSLRERKKQKEMATNFKYKKAEKYCKHDNFRKSDILTNQLPIHLYNTFPYILAPWYLSLHMTAALDFF